ncbi:relaxase/mobilization nuclease domain-containing protein [Mucilaginibacter paludis]|uniref:MobA/VirD2-like nuclease domain-containing protein n=1 Tax=Mucilaginibacter paludis DSM 18603 TaxID=714943 RepID=H1Y5P8_9SPHI|nr:relaxase/mobilization nuclease domain-containing protein [Mucilaginibacter paludis]EHQ29824.1 hypothetical protein Mucpa_5756 [Mucilaginibacter paludis DSM 18603]
MFVAGKIRGNAPQLGRYFFAPGENERITILHLDGREDATQEEFMDFLYSVELNSELTRSKNSSYHAYINPNPEDTTLIDRVMTKEEWLRSVEILTEKLEYEDQRHGAVLHDLGNGRVHAHIVYERYNHERGTMATYKDNYKAHDEARDQIEKEFGHKPTPKKNKNRGHHKQTLTEIWNRTNTAGEFMQQAEASGYKIAKGTDRPFRVVDSDGIGFDLVRKLDGIKTQDVKERFGETELPQEKEAIREMQAAKQRRAIDEPDKRKEDHSGDSAKTPALETAAQHDARQNFLQNIKDVRERNRSLTREITLSFIIALRVCFSFRGNATEQRSTLKQEFVTAKEVTAKQERKPPDKMLGFIEAAQFYKPT